MAAVAKMFYRRRPPVAKTFLYALSNIFILHVTMVYLHRVRNPANFCKIFSVKFL